MAAGEGRGGKVELADIFSAHGLRYRQTHHLALAQRRAMRAIETCRTAALGGHRDVCDLCGAIRIIYNSCRNRHCAKCQTLAKQRWLEARGAELLPIGYFHFVFTLPHTLNPLAQGNPRPIYNLLFHAAGSTLTSFARNPNHLGAELGVTAILHTWGQNLSQHIHIHAIVTGGGLTPTGTRWIRARRRFLFPVKALSRLFRGRYLDGLRHAFSAGELSFRGETAHLAEPAAFARWLAKLRRHDWVVYAKAPFAGPRQLLDYLGRYTHRVAISNERILGLDNGMVRFRWRDRAHGDVLKVMELEAEEFIRRFLLHVVPDGFVRIRHFGLLANRTRKAKLDRSRTLLGQDPAPLETATQSVRDLMLRLTGVDIDLCPVCHRGRMHVMEIILLTRAPGPPVMIWDSS
ncbi:MAG: IS91 family transposase [Nitrospiraceae bacterium]